MTEKQLIPAGYKQTEVGVIPEDWEGTTLGEISEVRMCKRIFSEQTRKIGEIPFFKIGTFGSQPDAYIPSILFEEYKSKYSFPEKGDILISAAGTLGKSVIYDGVPAYFQDSNIVWLEIDKNKLLNNYLYQYYKVIKWASSEGSTIARLYNAIIRSSAIAIPPIKEQTAIANALSDVDALIAALEKLINKKNAIKTAAMQQLLTGKKRLPPYDQLNTGYKQTELGEIPGDWEVASVHQLLNESPKYGINAAAVPLTANLPVYIRITDISEDGYFQPSERVGVNNQFSGFYKLQKGDIVIARTGASVGKSYLYREADGELIYAGFLIKLSPKESILDSMFLFQYFRSDPYWAWVNVMSMRSGQPGINGNEFGSLQIPLPSIDEQIAIANVFSDMDKGLEALQQRLHKTQQIKQGMMQELLTGKTRLMKAVKEKQDA